MKKYLEQNVFEASQERLKFIFDSFERVYLSFSGGKDSGVMLNLTLDYMRANKIDKKLGIMILDNEANYKDSTDFMERMIENNIDLIEPYWCCLPITLPCTVSAYNTEWQCWGEKDKDKWIRPLSKKPYVVNFQNHNFTFFKENMNYDEFWDNFGKWYGQGKKTACLIGIRTDESLNRFRAIMNKKKKMFDGKFWTKHKIDNVYNCYPIYDWSVDDIWTANVKFDWDYNELYDKFYLSGMSPYAMRVASPFMSESKSSLNLYRVIDPEAWQKLYCRVNGANFIATYGGQLDWKKVKLPTGHTWRSFTKFLLNSLPKPVADNYKRRFCQALRFWSRKGRGIDDNIIKQLKQNNIPHKINGLTPHGSKTKQRVVIQNFPDELDCLSCPPNVVASWKRFAITILRNDHTCKYLGLGQTQEQIKRQREIMEKYKNL